MRNLTKPPVAGPALPVARAGRMRTSVHGGPSLLRRGCLSAALASLSLWTGGLTGWAGAFNADFNGEVPPAGMTLSGNALDYDHSTGGVSNSGVLKLTTATGSQQGGAIIADLDAGATVGGFEVSFDLYIGSGNGADGMSFFFGDFADGAHAEEGPGNINGLTIAFDVYNSGGTPAEAPAIDLKWNNVIQLHRLVGAASTTTGAQPIGSANTIRTQTTAGGAPVYWPVKIRVDTDGTLDLAYNNVIVYTNVPIFRAITDFPLGGEARFGFGARTGGSYDNHWIDNLKITTFPLEANSGQPHLVSCLPLAMANATTGGPSSPVAAVMIDLKDWDYSVKPDSLTMTVNGTAVTPVLAKIGDISRISYRPASGFLAAGVNTIVVGYQTTSTPSFNNSFTYSAVVGTATSVASVYTLSAVDTTKPGFKVRVNQIDINRNPATGQALNAERQIADGYLDPGTGQPYPNTALTDWLDSGGSVLASADAEGFFLAEDVINWNQDAPAAVGNFSVNSTPAFEDQTIPGLTGNTGPNNTERCVVSIETILELKAGGYRFGVNSDDGFRLSIGRGPGDVVGVQFGTAGDRGAADTIMDVGIPADGFYPVRLMYFETGGGAACEFFFLDDLGVRWLVNDLTAPKPIKAYRESPQVPPYVSRALPVVGYNWAFADQDFVLDVTDGASPLNAGSALLTLNGVAQTLTEAKSGRITTLTRKSSMSNLLPSGANNVVLTYTYNDASDGGTTKSVTNSWTFNVPRYTQPIPVANKVAPGEVSGNGFKVRVHQLDRSLDANQGNGGRYTGQSGGGANMPRPEIQLADGYLNRTNSLPFSNRAAPGPGPDGTYELPEVLNFNSAQSTGGPAANAGIFNGDAAVPGLPGTATSNFGLDNSVHEITTYLELKAGVHIFGMNVDDGWLCISAPNARDTLGTLLGWRNAPGGQNGSPLNNPNGAFTVLVLEDGIYPFRLLTWQGGGGVNFEFLLIERNSGAQILVNDVNGTYPSVVANPTGLSLLSDVKAYSTYTGAVRPWTKFSVYPMPTHATLWQNTHQQSGPGPILVKVGAGNPADIANDEPRFDQALVNWPFGDAIGAIVADLGGGSVGMVLDGASVTPTVTPVSGSSDLLVMYAPNPPLAPKSTHTAGLIYAGTTNYWSFTVSDYVTLPAGTAVPPSAVDLNSPGFQVKVTQAAAARPGGNTVAAAESQLAGTPASVAVPGPEPDGAYIDADVLNWNVTMNPGGTPAQIGNFQTLMTGQADEPVPGIPGTGLSGNARFENLTAEICAYLDLPAGYQKFGINGDDGWKIQIGTPGQTGGPVLFSRDRGAGARDIPFAFITPEAGLYPIRLVWYQGGGGGNLEFFSYGAGNSKILVNDRNNPNAVKAYARSIGTPALSVKLLADGKVQVTFEGRLYRSAGLTPATWQEVSGATSPYEVAPSEAELYFRAGR